MKSQRFANWLLLSLAFAGSCNAETIIGRVVGVSDGDTITMLDSGNVQHKIRLGGIDAPESGQAFGSVSKRHLSDLAFGKQAEADCYKTDQYRRSICTVYVGERDAALAQLDAGLAWWYRMYAKEQPPLQRQEYESAEDRAAADGRGLWRDSQPIPPWEWRKIRKGKPR